MINNEIFEKSQNEKNALFEMFNKKVKEVKSISGTERLQRLAKDPQSNVSKFSKQEPQNFQKLRSQEIKKETDIQENTYLYRKQNIPTSPEPNYQYQKKEIKTPKLKSLDSRMKNILSPEPQEIVQLMKLDKRGKIQLNPKALEYLSKIEENIKVVSVIGPYRSGKSFLLNRLNGRQKGFHIGNSTNPCTQGVWLWGVNTGTYK